MRWGRGKKEVGIGIAVWNEKILYLKKEDSKKKDKLFRVKENNSFIRVEITPFYFTWHSITIRYMAVNIGSSCCTYPRVSTRSARCHFLNRWRNWASEESSPLRRWKDISGEKRERGPWGSVGHRCLRQSSVGLLGDTEWSLGHFPIRRVVIRHINMCIDLRPTWRWLEQVGSHSSLTTVCQTLLGQPWPQRSPCVVFH